MRTDRQLLVESRRFARDIPAYSMFCLLSAYAIFIALIAVCLMEWNFWLRLPASIAAGFMLVRLFIIYHDHQHGTILRKSLIARILMTAYGLAALNPPNIWKRSHDHHHKNNAKVFGASIGSFPVMTTSAWDRASRSQRIGYLIARHPLTIAGGYLTIFLYGMCIRSFLKSPREHWDSAAAIIVHGLLFAAAALGGIDDLLLAVVIPCTLASAVGSYLFYAQHNYPRMKIRDRSEWDYVYAALHSSSYIPMNPLMAYFTGNIGYHHVHHLNHRIPFYRLPAAMRHFPELQNPGTTTLRPADIARCLRLKLWDPKRDQLITLAQHRNPPVPVTNDHPPMTTWGGISSAATTAGREPVSRAAASLPAGPLTLSLPDGSPPTPPT